MSANQNIGFGRLKARRVLVLTGLAVLSLSVAVWLVCYVDVARTQAVAVYESINLGDSKESVLAKMKCHEAQSSSVDRKLGCYNWMIQRRFEIEVRFDNSECVKCKWLLQRLENNVPQWLSKIAYRVGYYELRQAP